MRNVELASAKYFALKEKLPNTRITLVTKGVETEFLLNFIKKTGHLDFAENYATQLKKWDVILEKFPNVRLSFIGYFQSGNIRNIVKYCNKIESIYSIKIFEKVKKDASKREKKMQYYAQINIGNEPQKSGFKLEEINKEMLSEFNGLMCIPPANRDHASYFKKMQEIAAENGIKNLSMGMSADYRQAVQFGATEVRIGSLIFGNAKV